MSGFLLFLYNKQYIPLSHWVSMHLVCIYIYFILFYFFLAYSHFVRYAYISIKHVKLCTTFLHSSVCGIVICKHTYTHVTYAIKKSIFGNTNHKQTHTVWMYPYTYYKWSIESGKLWSPFIQIEKFLIWNSQSFKMQRRLHSTACIHRKDDAKCMQFIFLVTFLSLPKRVAANYSSNSSSSSSNNDTNKTK